MPSRATRRDIEQALAEAFPPQQTAVLAGVLDDIRGIEVQRATDTRELKAGLRTLTEQVGRLVAAQQHTDERLAGFEERTDARFAELASAQKGTEDRLAELASAQKGTEDRLAEVATALLGTQEALGNLSRAVGGLANDFGFVLEDFVAYLLPAWLARFRGIEVPELSRDYVDVDVHESVEVDLMGYGRRDGEEVLVMVECKARLSGGGEARRIADKFDRITAALRDTVPYKVIVAMLVHPKARAAIADRDILIVPYSSINRGLD